MFFGATAVLATEPGAATRAADIRCDRPRLRAAFTHAHQMRERFIVLDLARLAGVLPAAYDEILDRWVL